eukprot:4568641-Amphidinium_carterae.1
MEHTTCIGQANMDLHFDCYEWNGTVTEAAKVVSMQELHWLLNCLFSLAAAAQQQMSGLVARAPCFTSPLSRRSTFGCTWATRCSLSEGVHHLVVR